MSKPKTGKAALVAAHAYMKEHGHCKYELSDGHGRVCVRGAINAAVTGDPRTFGSVRSLAAAATQRVAEKRLMKAIGLDYDGWGGVAPLFAWNNDQKRTKRQVLGAFRKAIKLR